MPSKKGTCCVVGGGVCASAGILPTSSAHVGHRKFIFMQQITFSAGSAFSLLESLPPVKTLTFSLPFRSSLDSPHSTREVVVTNVPLLLNIKEEGASLYGEP